MSKSLTQKVIDHRRDNEWWFAISVFSGAEDIALRECSWLSPDHLMNPDLKRFWAMVLEGASGVRAASDLDLTDEFLRRVNSVPNLVLVNDYASAIAEDVYLLSIIDGMGHLSAGVYRRDFTNIVSTLSSMQESGYSDGGVSVHSADDLHNEFAEEIRRKDMVILTHLPEIDRRTGGMFGTELITVASRPGMGKTALVLQIAENVAFSGKSVLFFSLEMSRVQLWARLACPLAGYEWKDVRANLVDNDALDLIESESGKLRSRLGDKFRIVDDVYSVSGMHRIAARYRPDFVVIDQLPDIVWHDPKVEPVKWYGEACKYLRQHIARDMGIPLLMVHQINRAVEDRKDKRPMLSDLRMSGEVEQRSDVVWLVYREDYYFGRMAGENTVQFEVNAAKNRQGVSNSAVVLNYDLKRQYFS